MITVTSTDLPLQSTLYQRMALTDFIDCYTVETHMSPRQAANIITDFPGWARFLVSIRNIVTTPFGLLKEGPEAEDRVGFFPVESDTPTELIAGFNDKHLDFRVSVMALDGHLFLATWVHPNNLLGRLYLKAILPFHTLISRNALARVKAISEIKQA
ncbi:DUF2867 domain-containing protein [Marinomonas posidonica]|uniref:DUF2867 domain-containing protein n=1 Tax=Marinomonas posidonica (strain CECT 7376 / NCIMB 14433 / IVIA-Po-181) TaxID=491952 RepID=F6D082_MARPP|nr:DUF2867 domain-containing protein [Marinomonas posidonica]AEF55906.1 hypothetical protein Mar181_2877 [Marinomonas posidonica IVIA-Po-181]